MLGETALDDDIGRIYTSHSETRPSLSYESGLCGSELDLFKALLSTLGRTQWQDVCHLMTAEKYKAFCFLTMDYKFIANLKAQKGNASVKALTSKALTPSQLGQLLGLKPFHHKLLSYVNATFPVRKDLNWPFDGRRKSKK